MRKVVLLALVLWFGPAAFAQDAPAAQSAPSAQAAPPAQAPKPAPPVEVWPAVEVAVDYSFLRFPQNSFVPSFNLNGGGASVAYFFNKHIGLHVDFQDYGTHSLNFAVPARTTGCSGLSDCPLSVKGTTFTYLAGPIIRFRVKRVDPFVEAMFGGAHDNIYAAIYKACFNQGGCVNLSKMPNDNAFDFIIGGGVDLPFKEHISLRLAQVDYEPTRFGNSLKANDGHANIQDNLRAQAGIVFKF
jgi:hypothetical protein